MTATSDLFVSYAGPDRPWAEWAGQELEAAGYTVELDVWDWETGSNFVLNMNAALERASRVLALYSKAYFAEDRFTVDEWTAVLGERPAAGGRRRLIPVRVQDVKPPKILAPLLYRDVFGLDEQQARAALLTAVGGPQRPAGRVAFPGEQPQAAVPGPAESRPGVRVPGTRPTVWNVPRRNPAFTGREPMLAALRQRLSDGECALVQALHGMGGVGKTQLAIEYAHLFAGDYQLAWWIDAERPDLIGEQLAALAVTAGWVDQGATVAAGAATAMQRLSGLPRWLLIFDNAELPEHLDPWLPDGPGHIVITSRNNGFGELAIPVEVDVFVRPESIALLRRRLPTVTGPDGDRLAQALGDLPLGLAQAAGLISQTRMPVSDYLTGLSEHRQVDALLRSHKPLHYPAPLAAAIDMSTTRLEAEDPATTDLLQLCALLAPEPVPLAWFPAAPAHVLGQSLAAIAAAPLAFRDTLGRLARYGLIRLTEDSLQLHRLTQAVLADRRTPGQQRHDRQRTEQLVAAAEPDNDGSDPASWPAWAALLPHLLVLDPATAGPQLRTTACNAVYYLLMRGEYNTAFPLAEAWHSRWQTDLHADDHHVIWAANQLASAHQYLGHYQEARRLDEDNLTRRRRILGDDHLDTLASADNLADDLRQLGEDDQARQLNEDTLARLRRTLGDDHPNTLASASNLAVKLWFVGEHDRANRLNRETLARQRHTLGDDHPDSLTTASNLAVTLGQRGEHEQARDLNEDTLARRRRVLGNDHPDTLTSATNLAHDLRRLGEDEQAAALEEEIRARKRHLPPDPTATRRGLSEGAAPGEE
ncbi:FxSxx-COOH system tetratricopeptide repeat protein [Actinoplanes sp. NPDC051411]|uniref:FxSxx-COOH system tetratricopeptide repeat protein n=1 Tax=Actinoplanes sp. NPDC051411 TaxID=3155522 RepID=UPI0034427ACE